MPKLSIIIPVYNVEEYLKDCLNSVLKQRFTDYEVICINDGSTDNSLQILNEYKLKYPQIKIIDQENKGLSAARNKGIEKATGDYILFLDSDDWLVDNALEMLANAIVDEDFIVFNGKRFIEDSGVEEADMGVEEKELSGWGYYNKYALQSRKFHFVCVVLRAYKRSFLLNNNLFFEDGLYHEDNLFTPIACYYAQKVKVIPDVLYVYRIRKGSITTNQSFKSLTDIIQVANKLSDFFIPKTDIDKSVVYRDLASYYPNILVMAQQYGFSNRLELLYKEMNLDMYKIITHNTINVLFYYLIKQHSPLIFWYPKISKFFRVLHLKI